MTPTDSVAQLFDGMADEYDQLEDEWYPHFFQVVEKMLRRHAGNGAGKRALDVGCGTGLQTVTLAARGYRTTGIDISAGLLQAARRKAPEIEWCLGSATALPFAEESFDFVACCGSVLGFIPEYPRALAEIARVLKPGGTFFLEVDHRWNLDLMWGLTDIALGGRLGYGQSAREAWRNVAVPRNESITQQYPFTKLDGSVETMPVRLFALPELLAACRVEGFELVDKRGVHTLTNLIPSTWLAHPKLSRPLRGLARGLARWDVRSTRFANNAILVFRGKP